MNAAIDPTFKEGMGGGMIGWHVPLSVYPDGYHAKPGTPLPFAALGAQKRHVALYLMGLYSDPELLKWFTRAWKATGKKLDMGKSCVRFRKLDDLALDVLVEAFRRMTAERYIEMVEQVRG